MDSKGFSIKGNGLFGIVFLVLILFALFFIVKGIFKILTIVSPILFIAALIINYRTVVNYAKFVLSLLQRSPLTGILAIILSIIGFPVLSGVLLGKAILDRKVRRFRDQRENEARG